MSAEKKCKRIEVQRSRLHQSNKCQYAFFRVFLVKFFSACLVFHALIQCELSVRCGDRVVANNQSLHMHTLNCRLAQQFQLNDCFFSLVIYAYSVNLSHFHFFSDWIGKYTTNSQPKHTQFTHRNRSMTYDNLKEHKNQFHVL